jgi:hypothetical protein
MLGDTGLRVGDVLGFYTGDWGDMLLRKQGNEIWGAAARVHIAIARARQPDSSCVAIATPGPLAPS